MSKYLLIFLFLLFLAPDLSSQSTLPPSFQEHGFSSDVLRTLTEIDDGTNEKKEDDFETDQSAENQEGINGGDVAVGDALWLLILLVVGYGFAARQIHPHPRAKKLFR